MVCKLHLVALREGKRAWKIEEPACGWSGWDKLPTPSSVGYEFIAKTLGMAVLKPGTAEKSVMILDTSKGCYKFPSEDEFKVFGCVLNRQGKTCCAVEERMQSANDAFWKDIMIWKSKDVPWKVTCQRLVDHVYAVFTFGSEDWSSTQQTMEKSEDGKPRRGHDYSV